MESITPIRVRYAETEPWASSHHAVSPIWMELGRSDLLRDLGHSDAEWEKRGVMMSVAERQLISRVL